MYAIVATGGKQVKVFEGDRVLVEKIEAPVGELVELNDVRLLVTESGISAEPGALSSAKVVCEVADQGRHKKIRVFKKKRRKKYRRTMGHRQAYTELRVREILSSPEDGQKAEQAELEHDTKQNAGTGEQAESTQEAAESSDEAIAESSSQPGPGGDE